MEEILVIIGYLIIGGMIGYAIRTFLDTIRTNHQIDKLNDRLDAWQKLDEKDNKKKLKF